MYNFALTKIVSIQNDIKQIKKKSQATDNKKYLQIMYWTKNLYLKYKIVGRQYS